ncbi:hypothetical protein [Paraburkholderia megapolitana]|uniref:hypothetical protein n=1 Tax=Paraburkholderia megapolitana TaxID=420953 RepID=UPI0038BE192B
MSTSNSAFILYAIDDDLLYPCLGTRFQTDDLAKLKRALSIDEGEDPSIEGIYTLSSHEATSLCEAFGLDFDHGQRDVVLFKNDEKWPITPYLFHTGFELPLLLQGRKKLGFMHFDSHNEDSQKLKARFDHYVAEGMLHSEGEICDLGGKSNRRIETVYYTPKGEEWRIRALMLIQSNAGAAGGWTEIHERLEGTLMGYEDWQNDWWLEQCAQGDGVTYGMSLRCTVTKAGYEWIVHSGNRALPPIAGASFTVLASRSLGDEDMQLALRDNPDIEAFVQFNIGGRHLMHLSNPKKGGPFDIPTSMIPEINRKLTRPIRIVAQRQE